MAARENQGYLIAVILLTLLSVILLVMTYFGFTSAAEYANQVETKQNQLKTEQDAVAAYQAQSDLLKALIGFENYKIGEKQALMDNIQQFGQDPVREETQKLIGVYDADMGRFVGEGKEDKTYKALVDNVFSTLAAQHSQVSTLTEDNTRIQSETTAKLAAKDETVKKAETELQTAKDNLAGETARNKEKEDELDRTIASIQQQNTTLQSDLTQNKEGLANAIKSFDGRLDDKDKKIASLNQTLEQYEKPQFDLADGKIVSVASTLGLVHVNLGYDDKLTPRQSFKVYDRGLTTYDKDSNKATIEITRVIGPHLAEGRITSADAKHPVLTDDFVLTSTWDPGYSVPIAIAGFIDLDGDGKSDRLRVESIISRSGGKVVAKHDEKGNISGTINQETRYLAIGDNPSDSAQIEAWNELNELARDNDVQVISIRNLLNSMGYQTEGKIEQLGTDIGREFRDRKPPERSPGESDSTYK